MSSAEKVEQLTGIMARQAFLIRELHNIVAQHNAVSDLDAEIEATQREADELMLSYGKY